MNNYTQNTYDLKRKNVNFSKKISDGVSKPTKKFVMDMQYGIAKAGSVLISEISRNLDEKINLNNTIDRLCTKLANLDSTEQKIIWNNYLSEVKNNVDINNAVVLFDDSDINKEYSKKLEDLDRVIDASSQDKKIVNGYHVCEAVALTQNEKQPISIYSKIYSCQSKNFVSKNTYTLESIKAAEDLVGNGFTGVFDRGYDDNKIYNYMDTNNNYFVIRLEDKRTLLFKGKKRTVEEVANSRKGKINFKALFDDNEEYDLSISYTKAILPYNNKEYTFVTVYGLSDKSPMKLLTNIKINDKNDVIKVARLYLSRWRIEEYFRGKKQEYDFENMRVRTLDSMNNLNMFLTIHLGHMAIMADHINKNLLTIKIIYASKSLKNNAIVWLSQIARGIKAMLSNAHDGLKKWQNIEIRDKYKQLSLNL